MFQSSEKIFHYLISSIQFLIFVPFRFQFILNNLQKRNQITQGKPPKHIFHCSKIFNSIMEGNKKKLVKEELLIHRESFNNLPFPKVQLSVYSHLISLA